MAELPRYFSDNVRETQELIQEARGVILERLVDGPTDEDELIKQTSQRLYAFTNVARYALSSLDGIDDEKGILSLRSPEV